MRTNISKSYLIINCIISVLFMISGCGFKGPLYMPPQEETKNHSSKTNTINTETESTISSPTTSSVKYKE